DVEALQGQFHGYCVGGRRKSHCNLVEHRLIVGNHLPFEASFFCPSEGVQVRPPEPLCLHERAKDRQHQPTRQSYLPRMASCLVLVQGRKEWRCEMEVQTAITIELI